MTRRSFFIAAICTIVQYYDYHLFGFFAARISKHFFSNSDPALQLIRTYMVMAIGVMAKPIGAIALGRIGDIYGRFATVIISLSGTAIASLIISLAPGYERVGILSALILLGCRMCVASLVSSGTDGIRIYIFEKIRSDKQCFGNGIVVFSTQVGSFFASISAWFFSLDFMPSYSWRIAFLIGSCMGLLSIILRMTHKISNDNDNLQDPDYESYKDQNIFKIAFHNSKLFILSSITAGCIGSTYQFIIIFFGTYNFELLKLVDQQMMQLCTSLGVILYMVFAVVGGAFADVVGKVRAANIASIALVALSGIFALIISYNRFPLSLYFLIIIILPFVTMPALTLIKQSIPKVIRYRLFSLAHAFGSIFLSAPTAYVSTSLYYYSELSWLPVLYFLSTILIMIFCINHLSKISSHPLNKPLNKV